MDEEGLKDRRRYYYTRPKQVYRDLTLDMFGAATTFGRYYLERRSFVAF
jgi:hypothetical protein